MFEQRRHQRFPRRAQKTFADVEGQVPVLAGGKAGKQLVRAADAVDREAPRCVVRGDRLDRVRPVELGRLLGRQAAGQPGGFQIVGEGEPHHAAPLPAPSDPSGSG